MKDQLQNRLFHYEEEPPAKVWKEIEYALNEGAASLSQRMEAFEAAPPSSAWKNIEAALQQPRRENVKPLGLRKIFRYAAAAAILFVVVASVRYLIQIPEKETVAVIKKEATAPAPRAAAPDTEPASESPAEITKRPSTTAQPEAKPVAAPARKVNGNRYVTVENEEGQQVRLSKKVAPVFNCAEAKVRASKRCQENIRELQEKIGAAFTNPSADFAGLMDMIKSLEKQQ